MKKKILKISISIILTALLYLYIGMVLTPKSGTDMGGTKYFQGMGFLGEKKDTVDMLAIGNSDLYSGFSPMELYNEYGYTCYNSGVSKQCLSGGFKIIKEFEKKQDVKVLMIEADFLFNGADKKEEKGNGPDLKRNVATSPITYHARWKDLHARDFYTLPSKKNNFDPYKGYVYSKTICNDFEYKDYMKEDNQKPVKLKKNTEKIFAKLMKKAEKNNIKVIVTAFPSPYSWSNSQSKGLEDLCNKYNIPLFDFNKNPEVCNIDFEHDFRDNGNHLNYYGMKKITTYIGKYINDNNLLENHKNDTNFLKWEKSLAAYKQRVIN